MEIGLASLLEETLKGASITEILYPDLHGLGNLLPCLFRGGHTLAEKGSGLKNDKEVVACAPEDHQS